VPFDNQPALQKHPQRAIVLNYQNPHVSLLEILLTWEELAGSLKNRLGRVFYFSSRYLRRVRSYNMRLFSGEDNRKDET
jgi:hypothetical protein